MDDNFLKKYNVFGFYINKLEKFNNFFIELFIEYYNCEIKI